MNRRQFLAFPAVLALLPVPKKARRVLDVRDAAQHREFVQRARQCGHQVPDNFLADAFKLFEGGPTQVEALGVNVLVPQAMAEFVWTNRKRLGIPLVASS